MNAQAKQEEGSKLLTNKKFAKVGFLSRIENQRFLPLYYKEVGRFDGHLVGVIASGRSRWRNLPAIHPAGRR